MAIIVCEQKDGRFIYREATPDELAAMQEQRVWHIHERPLRIVLTQDVWKDWLFKKREHEDMYELTGVELYPELVAVIGIINYLRDYVVVSEGNIYIYLEEIYPEHEFIIKNYMGIIERKQIV